MNAIRFLSRSCPVLCGETVRIDKGPLVAFGFLLVLAQAPAQTTAASAGPDGAFVAGSRELFAIDFSRATLGAPPSSLEVLRGTLDVVPKDGTRMLRATSASEFIITLNERLPEHFTLEFDVVSRTSAAAGGEELSFEGTPIQLINAGSAQIRWNHVSCNIQGGGVKGGDTWAYIPDELSSELMGQLARVRADFDGLRFKLYTNGQVTYNIPELRFVRGRVLRIYLGGQDDKQLAVYLARMRVAAFDAGAPAVAQQQSAATASPNLQQPASTLPPPSANSGGGAPMTVTGIKVTVNASGFASVTWDPLPFAATYFVMRWKPDDPLCCYNVSPPGMPLTSTSWQDGQLPGPGTYAYRVIATTSNGLLAGETTFVYQGGAPTPPPGVPTPGTVAVTSPTIAPAPVTTVQGTNYPPSLITTSPTTTGSVTGTSGTGTILTSSGPTSPTATTTTTTTTPTVTAVPVTTTTTGTITPIATTSPTTVTALPVATTTGTSTPITLPKYRVMLAGFVVTKPTKDDPLQLDGRGDEVFAAAAVLHWNRQLNQQTNFAFVQTRDFGDVGSRGMFGDRIKAGSNTPDGGIVAGDRVPNTYDIGGANLPAPTTDQFPLLLWEGTLTADVDALIICPSLWEHDAVRSQFTTYKTNWSKTPTWAIAKSATVNGQYATPSITSALVPIDQSVALAPPAPTFTGMVTSSYKIAEIAFTPNFDRPIGMGQGGPAVVTYQERFMVITYEKVAALKAGEGVTVSIPFAEPIDLFLGAIYMLNIRVQRLP